MITLLLRSAIDAPEKSGVIFLIVASLVNALTPFSQIETADGRPAGPGTALTTKPFFLLTLSRVVQTRVSRFRES